MLDTLKECLVSSKLTGGIGVSVHNIRATNSFIRGTNGTSNGIVPMLRVFNDISPYVDQGGGKRKGNACSSFLHGSANFIELLDIIFEVYFDCSRSLHHQSFEHSLRHHNQIFVLPLAKSFSLLLL